MTVVSFDCDRCDKPVKGMFTDVGTSGFYDVRPGTIWEDMRRGDETFVCDECVLGSVEYAACSRRLVASHPDNGIEFVWRDGKLIGPQDEGYAEAQECRKPLSQRIALDHFVNHLPRVCHLRRGHDGPCSWKRTAE